VLEKAEPHSSFTVKPWQIRPSFQNIFYNKLQQAISMPSIGISHIRKYINKDPSFAATQKF
jgi:hypothetical protein